MGKCTECGAAATMMVWGCCLCYGYRMCEGCAARAVAEDWGRATRKCEPTEAESLAEYLADCRP